MRQKFGDLRALLHHQGAGAPGDQDRWAALVRWLDAQPSLSRESQVYLTQTLARRRDSVRYAPPEWLAAATRFERHRRYGLANALRVEGMRTPLARSLPGVLSNREWANLERLEIHHTRRDSQEVVDAILELPIIETLTTLELSHTLCSPHHLYSALSRSTRLRTLLLDDPFEEVDLSSLTLAPDVLERLEHAEFNTLLAPQDRHGEEALGLLARGCKSLTLSKRASYKGSLAELLKPMRFDALCALDISGYDLDARSNEALLDVSASTPLTTLVYTPSRASTCLLDALEGLTQVAVCSRQREEDGSADVAALSSHPLERLYWQSAPLESAPEHMPRLLELDSLQGFHLESELVPELPESIRPGARLREFELRGHFDRLSHERVCRFLSKARGLTSIALYHHWGVVHFGRDAAPPRKPPPATRLFEVARALPRLRSLTCINHTRSLDELEDFLTHRPAGLSSLTLDFIDEELSWLLEKMRDGMFEGLKSIEIHCHGIDDARREEIEAAMGEEPMVFTRAVGSGPRFHARGFFSRAARLGLVHGHVSSCWA